MNMDGTTLCPHCETRFKIMEAQLEAHHGMVRCGNCLQAFDARPSFVPDEHSPQLELPMLDGPAIQAEKPPIDEPHALAPPAPTPCEDKIAIAETTQPEITHTETADFSEPAFISTEMIDETQPATEPQLTKAAVLQPLALAEQDADAQDESGSFRNKHRSWPWVIAALLLLLVLLAQAAYFFRVDLAARLPNLKPALIGFCQLLKCSVTLPQKTDLMSIESSELESNHTHENLVNLNALLRNRAPYAQAFPNLELTLNDAQDKPLARRIFKPADYLSPVENEKTGLLPNNELSIKLRLDTTNLKPTGYRLALFYPNGE